MIIYAIPGESIEWIDFDDSAVPPDGYIKMNGPRPDPTYYAGENGEWLAGPSPKALEQMLAEAKEHKTELLSQASNMIATLTDEIEGLEDAGDAVPEKLRNDLKAWKQYRVKVKNVDTSLVPNIEWPVAPPMLRASLA